jgi:polyisoprenyl-phosphate glycosyltransferase
MRFFPASLSFMGFDVAAIVLPHHPRAEGKSSYTFAKLAKLASSAILAHSQTPLKIAAFFGLGMAVASLLAAIAVIILALVLEIPVPGWASLIVAIFVVGGVQIFITGVVGIYVGKTFEEAKKRPLYFVKNTSNLTPPPRDA